jgi:hypothetical protein
MSVGELSCIFINYFLNDFCELQKEKVKIEFVS